VCGIRAAGDHGRYRGDALRGAIAPLVLLILFVKFNQHPVIDISTERRFNGIQIRPMAVASELHDGSGATLDP
jgi:hypothetical protein